MSYTHQELHQIALTFYHKGSEIQFSKLLDLNILTPNWDDKVEPYPEGINDDPLVTLTEELVACKITFLGEGVNGFYSTLQFEVENVGFDEVFDYENDLADAVEVARLLAIEWALDDPEALTIGGSYTVQFLAIFKVTIDTSYDSDGHADMMSCYGTFIKRAPMHELLGVKAEVSRGA